MSIVLDALKGKITWSTAAQQIANWGSQIVAKSPALTAATSDVITIVKQQASNALADFETALSPHIIPAVEGTEVLLDKALAGATGGISVPFSPILDAGITKIAESVKAGADAWALEQRAKAAAASPAAPPSLGS